MAAKKETGTKKAPVGKASAKAPAAAPAEKTSFMTPAEFDRLAEEYFAKCDSQCVLYDEAGLCLYLSEHNEAKEPVLLEDIRAWHDGKDRQDLTPRVKLAFLRIIKQIHTDSRYRDKGGMSAVGIFLSKQPRFGGYSDKTEQKSDHTVRILFGENLGEECMK